MVGGIAGPGAYSTHTRILDPGSDQWSNGTDVPAARINWQGAVIGGKLLAAGGTSPGRTTASALYSYDPGTDAWSSLAPLPQANEGYAGTEIAGLYCILGGRVAPPGGSFNTPFDRMDCYVPEMGAWLQGPRLPAAVEEAGAARVGGKLYVMGGRISFDGVTGAVYRLDDAG